MIYVCAGVYHETVTEFVNDIAIAAYPGERPELWGTGEWVVRFADGCCGVTLRGLVLDGRNVGYNGIKITHDGHHIVVVDCEIRNAPGQGILLTRGSRGTDISATFNRFVGCDVHHCGMIDLDHGFYLATGDNVVEHCRIHDNAGKGVHIRGESSGPGLRADRNVVRGNRIHDNARLGLRGFGVGVNSGTANTIANNVIWGNNGGIKVAYNDPLDNLLRTNTIANNGDEEPGVWVEATARGTRIERNVIWGQIQPIIDDGAGTVREGNIIEGNDEQ